MLVHAVFSFMQERDKPMSEKMWNEKCYFVIYLIRRACRQVMQIYLIIVFNIYIYIFFLNTNHIFEYCILG